MQNDIVKNIETLNKAAIESAKRLGDINVRTLEKLADRGNGNYAYIDSLHEAKRVLVEQGGHRRRIVRGRPMAAAVATDDPPYFCTRIGFSRSRAISFFREAPHFRLAAIRRGATSPKTP